MDKELDIPQLARRCWDEWNQATSEQREAEKESAGMWIGGKHQWRDGEYNSRQANNRPCLTINRCEPIVAQVENEARQNPPGPKAYPVGGGADGDGADVLEGLIREYESRSDAQNSYITGLRNGAARMRGCFELATEYVNDRSLEQQIVVREIPNPEMVFCDPKAVRPCREDALYQGKIVLMTREELEAQYGKELKIFERGIVDRFGGWMSEAAGWRNNWATISSWTGGNSKDGPYYVCEFWRVEFDKTTLTLYDNHVLYFDDETPPAGAKPMQGQEDVKRVVMRRRIKKYLVTALDVLDETEWPGDIIPIFWIIGPTMWVNGKAHTHSLLSGAIDAQRGLNYTATSAAEVVGSMTKSPWIGFAGQFDMENAQGINPWENQNGVVYNYMEINPTYATDPATGQSTLLPAPQRNTWEAPISRVLELANFFTEQIKAATSVFFEPSLPSAQKAQSGAAIRALQSQTNIGTLNWQDALHRAVGLSYNQAAKIFRSIYDSERVRTIIKADNSHEVAYINQEFGPHSEHEGSGQFSPKRKRNNIIEGDYSIRVTAGQNFETQREKTVSNLLDIFKIVPQLAGMPTVAARLLRLMGDGDPRIDEIADQIDPSSDIDMSDPKALQAAFQRAQQENQQLKQGMQAMQQAIAAKMPDIEARKWIAAVNALAGIRKAEITASKDADSGSSNADALSLEKLVGFAHDAATQAADHEHEKAMQASDQAHAAQTQTSDQAAADAQQQRQLQAQAEAAQAQTEAKANQEEE